MILLILLLELFSFSSIADDYQVHLEAGRCEQASLQFLKSHPHIQYQRFQSLGGVGTHIFQSELGELRVSAGLLAKVVVCPELAQRKKGKALREWRCSSDALRITFVSNPSKSCSALETWLQNFARILTDCYLKRADKPSTDKAKLQEEVLKKRVKLLDCRS